MKKVEYWAVGAMWGALIVLVTVFVPIALIFEIPLAAVSFYLAFKEG